MNDKTDEQKIQRGRMGDAVKSWVMVLLTLVFVGLYGSALIGWLRPLADVTMITRLEPIIFVIIGYYFGRLPAQANEKTLKDEIDRHTKRTDASQQAKETAEKEREVMEEKIRNAKLALLARKRYEPSHNASETRKANADKTTDPTRLDGQSERSVDTAYAILNS